MTYCENCECKIMSCSRNINTLDPEKNPVIEIAHLEGNPMFCKKNDWHGNQYKEPKSNE